MPHYDVVILGAGPGGYVAAVRSAQLGLSVAIIEEKYWGGVCLNVGCIPSKALLRNADLAHTFHAKADLFGISGDVHFDFGVAWDRSRTVAATHVKGIHFLMKKNKVTEYEGRGTFVDAHTIDVKKTDGSVEQVTFDNAIVSTGSTVRTLPGVQIGGNVVTQRLKGADAAAGTVTVLWRVVSRDGHPVSKSFTFTLAPAASSTPATSASATVAPVAPRPSASPTASSGGTGSSPAPWIILGALTVAAIA
ncbi:MAG: FAD-dependent oxidoreductase, partial [Microbacterium sp.]|nr:FAD-dependent oxidoreductase [Microbacterium sp.]